MSYACSKKKQKTIPIHVQGNLCVPSGGARIGGGSEHHQSELPGSELHPIQEFDIFIMFSNVCGWDFLESVIWMVPDGCTANRQDPDSRYDGLPEVCKQSLRLDITKMLRCYAHLHPPTSSREWSE